MQNENYQYQNLINENWTHTIIEKNYQNRHNSRIYEIEKQNQNNYREAWIMCDNFLSTNLHK